MVVTTAWTKDLIHTQSRRLYTWVPDETLHSWQSARTAPGAEVRGSVVCKESELRAGNTRTFLRCDCSVCHVHEPSSRPKKRHSTQQYQKRVKIEPDEQERNPYTSREVREPFSTGPLSPGRPERRPTLCSRRLTSKERIARAPETPYSTGSHTYSHIHTYTYTHPHFYTYTHIHTLTRTHARDMERDAPLR